MGSEQFVQRCPSDARGNRLGEVTEQIPTGVHLSGANVAYLAAKARRGAHLLDVPLTDVPPTDVPPTDIPLTDIPLTDIPLTEAVAQES